MMRAGGWPDFVECGSGLRYYRGQPRSLRKLAHWVASGMGPIRHRKVMDGVLPLFEKLPTPRTKRLL
jgi:hypothetical protein